MKPIKIVNKRNSEQNNTYPFSSIGFEFVASKFVSYLTDDSFVGKHIIFCTSIDISDSQEKNPDTDSSKKMNHRENIHNEQENSESDSEIDKHLLSSCFFELDIFFGNSCSECCQSKDNIHTKEIEDQGIERKNNESC